MAAEPQTSGDFAISRADARSARADVAATIAEVAPLEGWMSEAQGRRLWDAAQLVGAGGLIVEIGSFRGKSAIVLARGSEPSVSVVAIDPHGGGDRGPNEIAPDARRGDADNAAFVTNLERAGVRDRVRHVRKRSEEAHADVTGEIALLYIDGAHRYAPARRDIEQWGDRVAEGGTMLIHDAFNAIGVTLAQLRQLVFAGDFEYVGRSGSLVEYRKRRLPGTERLRNAVRQLSQLGYFARMVGVKVALSLHVPALARALGHDSLDWPY